MLKFLSSFYSRIGLGKYTQLPSPFIGSSFLFNTIMLTARKSSLAIVLKSFIKKRI